MARDPWKWRLPLVFASYLEEVEEVCAARVDFDCVLVCVGLRFGDVVDFEL